MPNFLEQLQQQIHANGNVVDRERLFRDVSVLLSEFPTLRVTFKPDAELLLAAGPLSANPYNTSQGMLDIVLHVNVMYPLAAPSCMLLPNAGYKINPTCGFTDAAGNIRFHWNEQKTLADLCTFVLTQATSENPFVRQDENGAGEDAVFENPAADEEDDGPATQGEGYYSNAQTVLGNGHGQTQDTFASSELVTIARDVLHHRAMELRKAKRNALLEIIDERMVKLADMKATCKAAEREVFDVKRQLEDNTRELHKLQEHDRAKGVGEQLPIDDVVKGSCPVHEQYISAQARLEALQDTIHWLTVGLSQERLTVPNYLEMVYKIQRECFQQSYLLQRIEQHLLQA